MTRWERRLEIIADELDAHAIKQRMLFAERLDLWREGLEAGSTPKRCAELSRVEAVTVRSLLARAQ